ncbi:transcription factor EAT1-like isoform X2 [Macadamia integrifolia]|uniref:transcription factor EAT1-like isoform X2 n=1 Tax=Macadamia integrifolia TaxID=60698 RepID=UPI001C4F7E6D|nr:transcription factor EAT1-like isoform X2 [Macadamia integrifolia]
MQTSTHKSRKPTLVHHHITISIHTTTAAAATTTTTTEGERDKEMYEEPQYFDSHDPNHMAIAAAAAEAELVDCPQTVTNSSPLSPPPPLMAEGGGGSSSHSHNSMEDNLKLSGFSLDEISNHHNSSHDGDPVAVAASIGIDLQQHLGFDLEHEFNTNLLPEMLQDPNQPPMVNPNWDSSRLQEMQDMNYNPLQHQHHHQQQQPQQMGLQQNLQCFNSSTAFATPDLLNLLHLPRCSDSSMLSNQTISFSNKKPSNYPASLDFFSELPTATVTDGNPASSSSVLFDHPPPLHLNLPPQPPLFRDLFHSLPHNYNLPASRGTSTTGGSLFGGIDDREGSGGGLYQDGDGRQFENSVLDFRRDMAGLGRAGRGRGTHNFSTEKQRREQINEKYMALRALIPNPTKDDRASVVGDAIEYIKELLRTVDELKVLVDKKKWRQERNKRLKLEEETTVDMESSSMKSHLSTLTDREQSFNGSLRSSWSQRKSKETEVDVRIIDDEVTIKLIQKKKMNCLLLVSKVLDELQLELLHVAGGNIGDYYSFLFNTKIYEGSSVYASAMAKKLLEVVDRQYTTFPPAPGSF